MKCFKIVDNVIQNVAEFDKLQKGWVEYVEGFGIGDIYNNDGTFSKANPELNKLSSKEIRDIQLNNLTYDFGDGRVIQTRPKDELNLRSAIAIMEEEVIPTIEWIMIDNKKYTTTLEELKTALKSGRMKVLSVWQNYIPD